MTQLTADQAFSAGAELWILEDNFNDHWWNQIDFRSGFLLSACLYHNKKPLPNQINYLVSETQMKKYSFTEDPNILLLGTADHFHNRWILLWKNNPEAVIQKLTEIKRDLKVRNIRLFSANASFSEQVSARLSASFDQISYVDRA